MTARRRRKSSLPFLAVPYYVLRSAAFRTLSPPATKLLFAVGEKYRGNNNGLLEMPFGELTRDWHYRSHTTISRAISELLRANLLVRTRKGRVSGNAEPSLYAMGWLPIPASERHTAHEIAARLTPQVLNAGPPSGPVTSKSVHPVDRKGKKCPILARPKNEVMRGLPVHCISAPVHQVDYLSRFMPITTLFSAYDHCRPLGGANLTLGQFAYLEFQNRAADLPMRPPG